MNKRYSHFSIKFLMARPTPPPWLPLLSDAALRQLSGTAVFARGQTYAASGAIETLEEPALAPGEQAALQAVVQGTQAYQVRVWLDEDDDLDGECDCPHAQDGNFCKHLVALCLAWRGELGGEAPVPDAQATRKVAAAAKRARTQASNRDALRGFVQAQSAEVLAERLWAWAENDRDLMADLKAWQAEHSAGSDTKALRGAIGDLLRQRGDYLDWHEMPTYMRRAGRVLPLLRPWLQRDPAELRALCEHALRCLYKVAEHADDSNGEMGGLMQELMDLLTQALRAAPPPAAWVDRWFTLMTEDPWGLWDETAILAAAGPAVQARYTERVRQEWVAWQPSHPATDRFDYQRGKLRRRYLASIEAQGDPRALLDAMADSAAEAGEFHELVALCETQGWYREALQWAQTAAKRHPKDWRSEEDLLRCYERDGWDDEALAIWRHRLARNASPEAYQSVLKAAERAGRDRVAYRAELFAWAEQSEADAMDARRKRPFGRQAGDALRDVSVRVGWLLAERDLDAALALVQQGGTCCATRTLETLARKLPPRHHAAAVQLLSRVFDEAMVGATSPYAKPLELVRDILERLQPAEQTTWLAELRTRYKPKRNFIAGLP